VSLPRTLTVSSNEIAEFFLVSLASSLSFGAISVFNFSWNLQSVPLSVIGVSYSLAAFPALTRLFVVGDREKFLTQMVNSAKHIIFWSVPVMTLFIVLRAQIVRVILGSGHFNWNDTRLTAAALALFTISLIPQSLTLLFVRAYYSRGETKKPLLMNTLSAAIIIGCAYFSVMIFDGMPALRHILEVVLRVEHVPGTSILMLPLGFSIGAIINMIMHWAAFEKDFPGFSKRIAKSLSQTLFASLFMGRSRTCYSIFLVV
jgi:peptidoglycan biosynthesis protein MviN/MurJ (putative lipid II flippase)